MNNVDVADILLLLGEKELLIFNLKKQVIEREQAAIRVKGLLDDSERQAANLREEIIGLNKDLEVSQDASVEAITRASRLEKKITFFLSEQSRPQMVAR